MKKVQKVTEKQLTSSLWCCEVTLFCVVAPPPRSADVCTLRYMDALYTVLVVWKCSEQLGNEVTPGSKLF